MSPRRTEALHELGYRQHLRTIIVIGFERGNLCGEFPLVVEPSRGLYKGRPDRFGGSHTRRLELAEGAERFVIESN